jgi:peptidoglycan-associated lipoprotein
MNRVLISALLTSLLAACSSTSLQSPAGSAPANSTAAAATPGSAAAASSQARQASLPPYLDPNNPLSQKRSVYFATDQYGITDDYKAMVQSHARYLAGHRDQKIRIEGNADENGSREYNLALGQKRAGAVRNAMVLLGVSDSQIEAVSWGKERPKALGHDEASWAENRRADIKYNSEK